MAKEQVEMSSLEEQDGGKMQNQIPDLPKQHDRVKINTDQTAVRPKDHSDISIWKLFKYADYFDMCLMAFGTVGTILDGMALPIAMLILSTLIDKMGNFGHGFMGDFTQSVNRVIIVSFKQPKKLA